MARFRKRPVEVEAIQVDWDNAAIAEFMGSSPIFGADTENNTWVEIPTLEGIMRANRGDWIIRGVAGEFYPCKPDIFEATYEPVETA